MSKLTREDKIEIYERRLKGETISSLAKSFNIYESKMKYEYCGISIGDDIKDIIEKFDISKIEYKDSMKRLYFKFGKFSKKNKFRMFFLYSYKNRKSYIYYNF